MKKTLKYIFMLIFAAWMTFLPIRSFLYVYRTVNEFKYPDRAYLEELDPCKNYSRFPNKEFERTYFYRRLGKKCVK